MPITKSRAAELLTRSPWEEKLVKLDNGPRRPAKVYGRLAVYRSQEEPPRYTVCLPEGIQDGEPCTWDMAWTTTEADCLKIGEYLWTRCCLALREKEREILNRLIPEWVKRWCRACREQLTWLDPRPFERKENR